MLFYLCKYFYLLIFLFFIHLPFNIFAQKTVEQEYKYLDSLGQIFWKKTSYNRAFANYEKALLLAQKLKDKRKESRVYNYLGVIAENQGNFSTSFRYHFQAIRIREEIKDTLLQQSYLNLGITYSSSGQTNKSIEYYLKSLENNKNKRLNTHSYYHLSTAFRIKKEYEKANKYAQKALESALKIKEKVIEIDAQNGLGLIATEQKKYEKAREYYQKVYDLAVKEQDWLILTNNLQHFAENYEQEKQYAKALEYAEKSLELAKKYELKAEEQNAYKILATLYNLKSEHQKAYEYQLKYQTTKDTLFNAEKNQQIQELTFQYETEKQQQKIEILEKNKKINQNTIYALIFGLILVLLLMVLIFAFGLYRYKTKQIFQAQEKQIATAKNSSLETKLLLIQMQKKLEQERFQEEMTHKERELMSKTLHIFQKNEILNVLQEKLNSFNSEIRSQMKPLFDEIRNNINLDKDWENFEVHFVKIYPNFFQKLQEHFQNLSAHELKLLAYIRLKLSNKEIANMLNVLPKSIEMARYRLKKKFNLFADDNLDNWLEKY